MLLVGGCVLLFEGDCVVVCWEGDVVGGALTAGISGVSDGDAVGAAVIALNVGVAEGEPVGADVSILSNVGAVVGSVGDFVGAIVVDEV